MYYNIFKSFLDIIISLIMLIILFPLILFITLILFIVNKGNPFFSQSRPGKLEKEFRLIKFRSMTERKDDLGNLLPDIERITRVGKLLRKTSLDELPQLFNVLNGDMSLVGPRPLLFKYLPLYNDRQRKRHLVKPGITGLAQINGRNSISWKDKFEFDVRYVENISLMLDVKIIIKTIAKVAVSSGINQSPERPMLPFTGNN